jgi:hypothetical protein
VVTAHDGSRAWHDPRVVIDDAWVDRWVAAVDGTPMPAGVPDAVVAWAVHDGPSWWLRIAGGAVRAGRGAVDDPAVVLATDATTAAALHDGDVSIEGAVLDGRLKLSGDVTRLPALRAAFDAVAEAARRS